MFAPTYVKARALFLEAAAVCGAPVASHELPGSAGRHGETLVTDVVRVGPAGAARLLVLTSGTHGVEGFCGSAAQTAQLRDATLLERLDGLGVAALVVHAINPHGFSWLSRTNEDNVDLNRNSIDFAKPLPVNADYEGLHALLVPDDWPPSACNAAAISAFIERHGEAAYQRALTVGQYAHPDGMFYGGSRPVRSTRLMQTMLAQHAAGCDAVGWIDCHTGLGPAEHGEKICVGSADATELRRACMWWGADVTSPLDGTTLASNVGGPILDTLRTTCPHAHVHGPRCGSIRDDGID